MADRPNSGDYPEWNTAHRDEQGLIEVRLYSPPKAVIEVCKAYLQAPFESSRATSSWKTDLVLAFHGFMCAEYTGRGDDDEKERSFSRLRTATLELMLAWKSLPNPWKEEPTCLSEKGVSLLEVLQELQEDSEFTLSMLPAKRGRGAPNRRHVAELAKFLSHTYRCNKKAHRPNSPAAFLAALEAAFLREENIAIGFPKKTTLAFSEGSRAVRQRAKKSGKQV